MTIRARILLLGLCLLSACGRDKAPIQPASPAATPAALVEHSKEFRRGVVKVTDGVYVAIGYGIANSILLEGTDGVIIVDTMSTLESAREVAAEFRKITDKPVRAIVYTHSHPDHIGGAPAFIPPGASVPIYAQAEVTRNLDKLASELQPIITRRSFRMYGTRLPPEEMVNEGIGGLLDMEEGMTIDVLRPTRTFDETLEDTVAGIHFKLVHAPGETTDQLFMWLPERRILLCGDNFYRAFPNLYTIRGTSYRDPKAWAASIDKMRALKPAFLVPSHTRPLEGEEFIYSTLTDYRDAISYVYTQTLHWMNLGLLPDEIAERVQLPPHLAKSPFLQKFYGEPGWSAKNIFAGSLGWFDGNPSTLRPLPPTEEAQHMADLAGGEAALTDRIADAEKKGDHEWVLQLSDYALRLNPKNTRAKDARLAALKAMGEAETNPPARHFYLMGMRELNGEFTLPARALAPTPAMLAQMPLPLFFDGMAVSLDAKASADTVVRVGFEFTDSKERYTYIVRRGVSEVVPELLPDLNIQVRVSAQAFKEMLAQVRNPAVSIIRDFQVVKGGKLDFVQFMRLFAPEPALKGKQ